MYYIILYCSATTAVYYIVADRRKSAASGGDTQRVGERWRANKILGTKNAVNDFFFFFVADTLS